MDTSNVFVNRLNVAEYTGNLKLLRFSYVKIHIFVFIIW